MDQSKLKKKISEVVGKFKYAILVLCVGLLLILMPTTAKQQNKTTDAPTVEKEHISQAELSNILSRIKGAGRVEVLLSEERSAQTEFQCNQDTGTSGRNTTVTVTDSQRNESGLVSKIYGPVYRGAIVVCDGADDPQIHLAIVAAVSNITGLRSDQISVLKMK